MRSAGNGNVVLDAVAAVGGPATVGQQPSFTRAPESLEELRLHRMMLNVYRYETEDSFFHFVVVHIGAGVRCRCAAACPDNYPRGYHLARQTASQQTSTQLRGWAEVDARKWDQTCLHISNSHHNESARRIFISTDGRSATSRPHQPGWRPTLLILVRDPGRQASKAVLILWNRLGLERDRPSM